MSRATAGEREVSLPRLVIQYDDVDDFVSDFEAALSRGRIVVESNRPLDEGAGIHLVLSVPGLHQVIDLIALVAEAGGDAGARVTVELEPADTERLAEIVDAIAAGDPAWVGVVTRILIVEDNASLSRLIRDGLTGSSRRRRGAVADMDFQFEVAASGTEALAALRAHEFDVAIVDLYLPGVSGAQVISIARSELPRRLPIIAMSAGGYEARNMAIDAGADVYMDKPVRLRGLLEAVVALARRSTGTAPAVASAT